MRRTQICIPAVPGKTHLPETVSPENLYLSSKSHFADDHTSQLYIRPSAIIQPEH